MRPSQSWYIGYIASVELLPSRLLKFETHLACLAECRVNGKKRAKDSCLGVIVVTL